MHKLSFYHSGSLYFEFIEHSWFRSYRWRQRYWNSINVSQPEAYFFMFCNYFDFIFCGFVLFVVLNDFCAFTIGKSVFWVLAMIVPYSKLHKIIWNNHQYDVKHRSFFAFNSVNTIDRRMPFPCGEITLANCSVQEKRPHYAGEISELDHSHFMKFWILYGTRLPRCLKIKCYIKCWKY